MIIVGIDCCSKQSSVCIVKDGTVIYTAVQNTNTTHSANLMNMIDGAFKVCGISAGDVDLYAVSEGPGSFTGIRIGLATVKGLAFPNNTPCIGVSSLKAMAECVPADSAVIASIDARRSQVYAYFSDGEITILDDVCTNVNNLSEYVSQCKKDIILVGDGSDLCYNTLNNLGNMKKWHDELVCVAKGVCLLAEKEYKCGNVKTHFDLTPVYLRLSQAEAELQQRLGENK